MGKIFATMLLQSCQLEFDMQHDYILKKFDFGLRPTPYISTPGAITKITVICFMSIAALPACKLSAQLLTIALVIAKFTYLAFDPLVWIKGGGVKL